MPETAEAIANGVSSVPQYPGKSKGNLWRGLWERITAKPNVAQGSQREPTTIEESNLLPKEWLDNP